jgi:hypothetical protein
VFGEIRILQVSQTQYEFYYKSPEYSGFGVMQILTNDTYTHEVPQVSEPTGTYINPTIKYAISSELATFNTPVQVQGNLSVTGSMSSGGDPVLTTNTAYTKAEVDAEFASKTFPWFSSTEWTGTVYSGQRYIDTGPVALVVKTPSGANGMQVLGPEYGPDEGAIVTFGD